MHTPGPWKYDDFAGGFVLTNDGRYLFENVSEDETGAFIKNSNERAANGRLVAAAPELLEVCELIMKHGADWLPDEYLYLLAKVIDKAKGA